MIEFSDMSWLIFYLCLVLMTVLLILYPNVLYPLISPFSSTGLLLGISRLVRELDKETLCPPPYIHSNLTSCLELWLEQIPKEKSVALKYPDKDLRSHT